MAWATVRGGSLRRARKHAKLSQVQVAERLGVHLTTVQRAEKGEHALATDLVDSWCRLCNVSLEIQVVPQPDNGSGAR